MTRPHFAATRTTTLVLVGWWPRAYDAGTSLNDGIQYHGSLQHTITLMVMMVWILPLVPPDYFFTAVIPFLSGQSPLLVNCDRYER